MQYSKTLVMVVVSLASVLFAAFHGDGNISPVEWVNFGLAVAGAVLVYVVPNLTGTAAHYAKGAVAFTAAALTLLQNSVADGVTMTEWWQLIVAGLGAIGVVALPGPLWDAVGRTPEGVRTDELRP